MDKLIFNDVVLFDFSKILQSNTIKGFEWVTTDPGTVDDNIVYFIVDTNLYIRFNSLKFIIGSVPQP